MENAERVILKTSLITFAILIGLLVLVIAFMSIFFPKPMFNLCHSLGFQNLAFTYAENQYKKSKDINDLHTLIYSALEIDHDRATIKYCEKLFQYEEYDDFIAYINELNRSSTNIEIAQIAITNENNYLLNQYVRALCDCDRFSMAVDFVIDEMYNNQDWQIPARTIWLLAPLITVGEEMNNYEFMYQICPNSSHSLIYLHEAYLDKVITSYFALQSDETLVENGAYIRATLAYDLNQYLSHLIYLEGRASLELHDFAYYKNIKESL